MWVSFCSFKRVNSIQKFYCLWLHFCFVLLYLLRKFLRIFSGDVKIINMSGRLKSSRKLASELHFDFIARNIGEEKTAIDFVFTAF